MPTRVDRRTFLSTAACTAAALAAGQRRTAAADAMFVSLNGSLTRAMPWPDFARLAARLGYGGVDVNLGAARKERLRPERGATSLRQGYGGPPELQRRRKPPSESEREPSAGAGGGAPAQQETSGPASFEESVQATRALLAELKIKPGVASLPVRFGGTDEAVYREELKQLGDAAAFCAAIGCPRMMTVLPPSSQTPKAEFRPLVKDRLLAIGEILARSNVRLGLEFLGPLHFRTRNPHEFIWRMDEALAFSRECGPNVGLTLDAWHWHHARATAADILAAGKDRIVHVHVSDARQQPPEEVRDNQRVMPGEGVIDLATFFRALQETGYADAVSPEPIGRVPAEMSPEDGARLGLETTLQAMRKAGVRI